MLPIKVLILMCSIVPSERGCGLRAQIGEPILVGRAATEAECFTLGYAALPNHKAPQGQFAKVICVKDGT